MADREDEMTDAELDQPATKRDIVDLRRQMDDGSTALHHRMDEQSAELHRRMEEQSGDLHRRMDDQSAELQRRIDDQSAELRRHMDDRSAELRRHFDVVAENFDSRFGNLFDWTQSTTSTMGDRIDGIESRVTRLERRPKR